MRNQYKLLGRAIEIATQAHSGQFDRGGKPYILHPLHLMSQMMYDVELAQIAVLHDVMEDCPTWGVGRLQAEGFSERVLSALVLLTHGKGDTYEDYILKVSTSYDAIRVKRKDLEHNSCITRLKGVSMKDLQRAEKYHKAFTTLGKAGIEGGF